MAYAARQPPSSREARIWNGAIRPGKRLVHPRNGIGAARLMKNLRFEDVLFAVVLGIGIVVSSFVFLLWLANPLAKCTPCPIGILEMPATNYAPRTEDS